MVCYLAECLQVELINCMQLDSAGIDVKYDAFTIRKSKTLFNQGSKSQKWICKSCRITSCVTWSAKYIHKRICHLEFWFSVIYHWIHPDEYYINVLFVHSSQQNTNTWWISVYLRLVDITSNLCSFPHRFCDSKFCSYEHYPMGSNRAPGNRQKQFNNEAWATK